MRRRRVLALGAAAVGVTGCFGVDTDSTTGPPAGTSTGPADGAVTGTTGPRTTDTTPSIGGSLHGRPFRLGDDVGLVERSNTEWIHAFLDVRKKYDRDAVPEDDPDVAALRRVGRETGVNLFVSLQWNFIGIFGEQESESMPPPGSPRERGLIEYATELLAAIEQPVDVIGLGNEPIWETLDEDFMGGSAPLIPFTRRVKDHLVDHYTAGDPRYVLGAFNRLYNDHVWEEYRSFYRQLFDMARTDDDIDGIDLHIHYADLQEAEEMLAIARGEFPDGMMTVTEFSPMWRYDHHLDDPLTAFEAAEEFVNQHGISDGTTVAEYLDAAKYDRLSREEMAAFYEVMPWYNVDFVEDMYDLLADYGVSIGTFGFLVEDDVRQLDWTDDWAPFPINCLFQPALIDTEDGAHPHYLDDFRGRT